jgi:hypothetical protein
VTRARRGSLAVALALGLLGLLPYPVWFVAPSSRVASAIVILIALALVVAFLRRQPVRPSSGDRAPPLLLCAAGLVLGGAAAILAALAFAAPHGTWDAWSIFNLAARFLHRGGEGWTDLCTNDLPVTFYPLSVSLAVAIVWTATGVESMLAPIGLALVCSATTVALTATSVAERSREREGLIAAMLVVSSERFLVNQAAQCADVPMGIQLLAALSLAADGSFLLAGLFAGFAAWTKNEGSLYAVALIVATAAVEGRRAGARASLRAAGAVALGALPGIAALLHWKHLAPPDWMVTGHGQATLGKLTDSSRWVTVLAAMAGKIARDTPLPVLGLYLVIAGGLRRESVQRLIVPILALALSVAGLVIVFLTVRHELRSQIDSSLSRVLVQLTPSAVFIALSAAGSPLDVRPAAR